MVGFNRRFAPMYVQAKQQAQNIEQIVWDLILMILEC